jgi:hypothetical protein
MSIEVLIVMIAFGMLIISILKFVVVIVNVAQRKK